jgi:hypothetical protein
MMTTMLITPLAILGILVASFAALRHAFKHAVNGYENESGFYEGIERPPVESFVKTARVTGKKSLIQDKMRSQKSSQTGDSAAIKPPFEKVSKTSR